MSVKYLSSNTIKQAYEELKKDSPQEAGILFTFLILKSCGYNRLGFQHYSLLRENGYDVTRRLSFLFSNSEKSSAKYDFINPFLMTSWEGQPTEPLHKWVPGRVINNILGGGRTWKKIIDDEPENEQFKFKFNYLNEISELLKGTKPNLIAAVIWANRYTEFPHEVTSGQLVEEFVNYYKLDKEEIGKLFRVSNNALDLSFSSSPHKSEEIRGLIGAPPSFADWIESIKLGSSEKENYQTNQFIMPTTSKQKITKEFVLKSLNDYKQVILSGPPGTSKSYIAEEVSSEFDNVIRLQFHPQYSYQDFIGGYVVEGSTVKYKKGVILELLERIDPNKKYLVIIDEINRANIGQVFGETLQCLDRTSHTSLAVNGKQEPISLPQNLYFIGTMNSSDRTIGSVDHAVRRRFLNIYCPPEPDTLIDLIDFEGSFSMRDFLVKLNSNLIRVLKNRELVIGQTIFLVDSYKDKNKYKWDFAKLEVNFNNKILPIIEEYSYGDQGKINDIVGEKLNERLSAKEFESAVTEFTEA